MTRSCIIYTRYSPRPIKAGQSATCSCEYQESQCRDYARGQWRVSDDLVFADRGVSGADAERPGLDAALKAAVKCKGVFLCYSLSRFSRSLRDACSMLDFLQRRGVDVVTVKESINTTTTMGRFVFQICAALGEMERELISERTRDAQRYKMATDGYAGGLAPYGYSLSVDANGRRCSVPNPAEMVTVKRIMELSRSGLGRRKIKQILDAEGALNRNGSPFAINRLEKIIRRENYKVVVATARRPPESPPSVVESQAEQPVGDTTADLQTPLLTSLQAHS